MNPTRIELKLILDKAGIDNLDLNTFSQRLNVQKRIYLVQLLGNDLGYRFSWYLRGPYCSDLTAEAFTLRDEIAAGDRDFEGYSLSAEATNQIEKAKRLWALPEGVALSSDQWLELLASIHYLKHIAYWPNRATKDFNGVFDTLAKAKPQFANARAAALLAWERLNQFGLINAKTAV